MKLSKNFHLGLGLLFTIEFIYSLFDQHVTHELFFWDVNIWVYRTYRFALVFLFATLYLKEREEDLKKNN